MMIPQAKNMYGTVQSPPARLRVEAGEDKVMIVTIILISTIIINTMIIRSVNPWVAGEHSYNNGHRVGASGGFQKSQLLGFFLHIFTIKKIFFFFTFLFFRSVRLQETQLPSSPGWRRALRYRLLPHHHHHHHHHHHVFVWFFFTVWPFRFWGSWISGFSGSR